ncbi:glycosyltransferase family 87 protein [Sulfitobacter sp. F26204]|uniref:glycosyltransferase family 87 protein n=1 Tax=Sulfitobacter sp. F26204 TaxID=2996014 RepID=UPI00225DE858|nr:glycosyltransferase family 87 protein [Sulfitobacter sp. F26204]MCX7560914.1 glycosyltransferase family 87 protein [Sulfitobacter sp. F26204]
MQINLKPTTMLALCIAAAALVLYVAFQIAFPVETGKANLIDFDIFHLAGTMIGEGNLAAAYDIPQFLARLETLPGHDGAAMFWSYPPPYNLVVAPLAWLPAWLSYILFIGASLAAYVAILRRLAGPDFHLVLLLMLPLMALCIRTGQNSFITGALVGLTCVYGLRSSVWAGVPLGLMVIKPHLALGLGMWSLLDRKWSIAAVSLTVVALICALATLVLGTEVWPQSLTAIRETGEILRDGNFALYRMTSFYVFGVTVGLEDQTALVLHLIVACAAVAVLAVLCFSTLPPAVKIGAGVYVSAMISPYNYDYDLAMLGMAMALLMPTVRRFAKPLEAKLLLAGVLVVSAHGLLTTVILRAADIRSLPVSLLGPVLLLMGIMLTVIALRERSTHR